MLPPLYQTIVSPWGGASLTVRTRCSQVGNSEKESSPSANKNALQKHGASAATVVPVRCEALRRSICFAGLPPYLARPQPMLGNTRYASSVLLLGQAPVCTLKMQLAGRCVWLVLPLLAWRRTQSHDDVRLTRFTMPALPQLGCTREVALVAPGERGVVWRSGRPDAWAFSRCRRQVDIAVRP